MKMYFSKTFFEHFLIIVLFTAPILTQIISPDTTVDKSEGRSWRLPNTTYPLKYHLHITTWIHREIFNFNGNVTIELMVKESTSELVFHAKDLEIQRIFIEDLSTKQTIGNLNSRVIDDVLVIDVKNNTNLSDDDIFISGHLLRLEIHYAGVIKENNFEFQTITYKVKNKQKIAMTSAENPADVEKIFKKLKVVPDVITAAPNQFLKVTYKNGLLAENGVELTPTQVKTQPQIEWNVEPDSFYTLIMTDPDAPSRESPTNREFNHWLVGNIPGSAIDQGEVLVAYVGSGPPKGTGLHRYVFLVYKQPGKLKFSEPHVAKNSSNNRPRFHAAKFAQKYKLGEPIAGNFYQAQWDDYVPTVHKQLSGK